MIYTLRWPLQVWQAFNFCQQFAMSNAAQMQSRMDELSTQTARIIADQVQRARTRTPLRTHVAGGLRGGRTARTEQTALQLPQEEVLLTLSDPCQRHAASRRAQGRRTTALLNDLPVAGLRDQISEVGDLLAFQGSELRALLMDVRQRREEADVISQRLNADLQRRQVAMRVPARPRSALARAPRSITAPVSGGCGPEQEVPVYILREGRELDSEGGRQVCAICLDPLQVAMRVCGRGRGRERVRVLFCRAKWPVPRRPSGPCREYQDVFTDTRMLNSSGWRTGGKPRVRAHFSRGMRAALGTSTNLAPYRSCQCIRCARASLTTRI